MATPFNAEQFVRKKIKELAEKWGRTHNEYDEEIDAEYNADIDRLIEPYPEIDDDDMDKGHQLMRRWLTEGILDDCELVLSWFDRYPHTRMIQIYEGWGECDFLVIDANVGSVTGDIKNPGYVLMEMAERATGFESRTEAFRYAIDIISKEE